MGLRKWLKDFFAEAPAPKLPTHAPITDVSNPATTIDVVVKTKKPAAKPAKKTVAKATTPAKAKTVKKILTQKAVAPVAKVATKKTVAKKAPVKKATK